MVKIDRLSTDLRFPALALAVRPNPASRLSIASGKSHSASLVPQRVPAGRLVTPSKGSRN